MYTAHQQKQKSRLNNTMTGCTSTEPRQMDFNANSINSRTDSIVRHVLD